MAQLADAEEGPSELVVAEGSPLVALLRFGDADLQLVLCPRVSHYFPVVDALQKRYVSKERSVEVILFL